MTNTIQSGRPSTSHYPMQSSNHDNSANHTGNSKGYNHSNPRASNSLPRGAHASPISLYRPSTAPQPPTDADTASSPHAPSPSPQRQPKPISTAQSSDFGINTPSNLARSHRDRHSRGRSSRTNFKANCLQVISYFIQKNKFSASIFPCD